MCHTLVVFAHLATCTSHSVPSNVVRQGTKGTKYEFKHSSWHFTGNVEHIPTEEHRQRILTSLLLKILQRSKLISVLFG